ncbi:thiamine pyrophosphate-dependent enzyme [Paradesulfitobacterium ferrireducens]|uniref:thiamine pyrophosphate-dependent enzyme n=1 Tax=Paradesulfitobacterium ferrireducens TaxID=2816476 RepID=UPI001A90C69E|nr:thiamine pyrophosphate-dependent enzyme [Paradesulfitobacterium ferrireducens]
MDTTRRRPGIDWIHTALVQGNLVRDYVKWDDQPYSLAGVRESLQRGYRVSMTEPKGPVYICFDAGIQEQEVDETGFEAGTAVMTGVTVPPQIPGPALQEIARLLVAAGNPVAVADQVGRQSQAFDALIQLAELLSMPVIEPQKRVSSLNFPTAHGLNLSGLNAQVLQTADLVLALEVEDLYGALHPGEGSQTSDRTILSPGAKIINIGLKEMQRNSWVQGYQRFQPADLSLSASVSQALPALVGACRDLIEEKKEKIGNAEGWRLEKREQLTGVHLSQRRAWLETAESHGQRPDITRAFLALQVGEMLKDVDYVLANGSLKGWVQRLWELKQPQQWLGGSGGAGLGYGLGAALGAALAYRGSDTVIVDLQADGDFLFTPSALWTAAHYQLPVLIIMDNNRGYYNSVDHQNKVAAQRGRSLGKAAEGTLIQDPAVDFAALARSFGVYAEGPVTNPADLAPALERVLQVVKVQKRPALLDVVTSAF